MENKVTADYLDEEGCLHCGICGKRKQMKVAILVIPLYLPVSKNTPSPSYRSVFQKGKTYLLPNHPEKSLLLHPKISLIPLNHPLLDSL